MKTSVFHFVLLGMFFLKGITSCQDLCAKEYRNGFDDRQASWILKHKPTQIKKEVQRRNETLFVRGRASEVVQIKVRQQGAFFEMTHVLPPARVIDDLTLTLWVRSNRASAQLFLRVVFPHQKDRRTGTVLSTWLGGSKYSQVGKWEQLECTTSQDNIKQQIRFLRSKLSESNLDFRDAFVDRVVLASQENPGAVEYFVDELQFGPIVDARSKQKIAKVKGEFDVEESSNQSIAELRLGTLHVKNRPFFPRITPYHNEEISEIKGSGLNLVWIPNYRDNRLLSDLQKQGIYSMAAPPRARDRHGNILQANSAGLPTFDQSTSAILFWNLGQHVSSESKQDVKAWTSQIHQADRHYSRPIMIDVSADEEFYSQYVSMLGVSRHVSNTSLSYKEYRDWLISRKRLARPGSFAWTWIQTEPNATSASNRHLQGKSPVVIEPEQIRLQVYSALAAGCRGIGYWKTFSLDGKAPGAKERKLVISQLNQEIDLVEEWLATGNVIGRIPFQIGNVANQNANQSNYGFRNAPYERKERDAILRERHYQSARQLRQNSELEATIIRGDSGLLLLPVWYGKDSQFCPGKMSANDVNIVVPGVDESAIAWEVSTTSVRSLPRQRVAGGIRITLKKFDMTSMIILTSDRQVITRLKARVANLSKDSAEQAIELAKAKYLRVKAIDNILQLQGVGQADANQILAQADGLIKRAAFYFSRRDFNSARLLAADTMQSLRILQRAYWNDATRSLSSPVTSLHTVSFQTLPDHWKMVSRLGRTEMKNENNLLRSGNFEDIDTMTVERWRHAQNDIEGVQSTAELYPKAQKGNYSLRLIAVPKTGTTLRHTLDQTPVLVSTPPMNVRSGQIVHISGWVKVTSRTVSGTDGLMIYDSLGGARGAIRWKNQRNWRQFEIIREVSKSGPFTVTIALTGLGEVQIDELKVSPHNPQTLADATVVKPKRSSRLNALDLWNRLPSIPRPELPEFPSMPRPEFPNLRNIRRPQLPTLRSFNPLSSQDAKENSPASK